MNLLPIYSAIQSLLSAEIWPQIFIFSPFCHPLHSSAVAGGNTHAPAPSYTPGCKNCEYYFCAIKKRTSRDLKVEYVMNSQRFHLATLTINSFMVSRSHVTLRRCRKDRGNALLQMTYSTWSWSLINSSQNTCLLVMDENKNHETPIYAILPSGMEVDENGPGSY